MLLLIPTFSKVGYSSGCVWKKYLSIKTTLRMMEATKTIKCKLIGLTKRKRELLNREYDSFQHWLETGEDRGIFLHISKMRGGYTRKRSE